MHKIQAELFFVPPFADQTNTYLDANLASSYWADEDDVLLTLSVHPLCSILGQERCTFTFSSHDKRKSPSISKKFVILMLSCCQCTLLAPWDVSQI